MEYILNILDNIRTYDIDGLQNIVKEADWLLTATEGDFIYNVASTSKFSDPKPEQFTAFNDLTEAQLKSWVENTQEFVDAKQHAEQVVAKHFSEPELVEKTLPWLTT